MYRVWGLELGLRLILRFGLGFRVRVIQLRLIIGGVRAARG